MRIPDSGLPADRNTAYATFPLREYTVQPFDVSVTEDGEISSYDIQDDVIRNQVTISKVDSETHEPIVSSETAELNGDWVTMDGQRVFTPDSAGTLTLPETLKYGTYEIHEMGASTGYWIAEEPLVFEITYNIVRKSK